MAKPNSWGTDCDIPQFDQHEEAEELLEVLLAQMKAIGFEIKGFPDIGTPVLGTPVRKIEVRNRIDSKSAAFCDFIFHTTSIPVWRSPLPGLFTPINSGHILFDLFPLANYEVDIDKAMEHFLAGDGMWPLGWCARACKSPGKNEVYLELQTLPYQLKELSYLVRPVLVDFLPNVNGPILVKRASLTERTPANKAFLTAVKEKTKFLTGGGGSSRYSVDFLQALATSIKAMVLASSNWETFKLAFLKCDDMECVSIPRALQMDFTELIRQPNLKPNAQVWFTARADADMFTVFYDCFYGHTSVHVSPQMFDMGGLDRMRHAVGVLGDQLRASTKKPRYRKQTVLVEEKHDGEEEDADSTEDD